MKYRAGKIKREHHVIERLWPTLEQIAACELITSIIPGPISRLKSKGFELTFQRFTDTGLRLLAKNGSAVQEVYAVADDKEAAYRWLEAQGLIESKHSEPHEVASESTSPVRSSEILSIELPHDTACTVCGRLIRAGSRAVQSRPKGPFYAHIRCVQ